MNCAFPYGTATPILPGYELLVGSPEDDWLAGSRDPDEILGGFGADWVLGGRGGDLIYGGSGSSFVGGQMALATAADGADSILGCGGDDLLDGAGGDDVLRGGAGDDTLIGGLGADRLIGGPGQDLFRFGLTPTGPDGGLGPANRDVIADFTPGEDLLDLRGYRGDGGEALTWLGEAPLAARPHGAVRVEARGEDMLVELDLALPSQVADGVADVAILLRETAELTTANLLL